MSHSIHRLGGAACEPPITAQEQAGHQSVSGEPIHAAPFASVGFYTSLSLLIITIIVTFTLFQLLNCSYIDPQN